MPKFLLIDSEDINDRDSYDVVTVPKLKWFDTEDNLLTYLETWGSDIKDPLIYELAGRVNIEKKLTINLSRH